PGQINLIEHEVMRLIRHWHRLTTGENLVTSVLLIPLRDGCILVHVLNDIAPADPGVVGTERNLSFLGAIRDDAHLGAAKIVVEEILEPHAGDKQEIPTV